MKFIASQWSETVSVYLYMNSKLLYLYFC